MKLEKIKSRGAEWLYRETTSKMIYVRRYRKDVGEVKVSTRSQELEAAKKFRDDLFRKEGVTKVRANLRKTALESYDAWVSRKKESGVRENTINSMMSSRNFFESFFETMLPDEITSEWWTTVFIPQTRFLQFKPVLQEDGSYSRQRVHRDSPRKFYNDWKWASSFLKQLVEDGSLKRQHRLINPDPEREVGRAYSDQEVLALLEHAGSPNLKLAILMAVTMGMRRSEIFKLHASRVDAKVGVIRLKSEDTKTKDPRSFALSPQTRDEVLARSKASQWIFPSEDDPNKSVHVTGFKRAWATAKRKAGVEGRFHFLRHTFLTKAFGAPGANPAKICCAAGLSLEEAQKTYLHFKDEDLKEVASLVSYDLTSRREAVGNSFGIGTVGHE